MMDSYKIPFVGRIVYSTYSSKFKHRVVHAVMVKDDEHLFNWAFNQVLGSDSTAELIDVITLSEPVWVGLEDRK
jgi:hypothetical protein